MARARRLALVALVGLAVAQTPTPRPTPPPVRPLSLEEGELDDEVDGASRLPVLR